MIFVKEIQNTCYDLPGTIFLVLNWKQPSKSSVLFLHAEHFFLLEKLIFIYLFTFYKAMAQFKNNNVCIQVIIKNIWKLQEQLYVERVKSIGL